MKTKTLLLYLFIPCILWSCSHETIELEWIQEDGYRWAELPVQRSGHPGFAQLSSSATGITIKNILTDAQVNENRVLLNGSGVAAGDVDGDGLTDLYFTSLSGENKLYKNLGGYRFEDITDRAGVGHEGYLSTGTVLVDINGDGPLDLLVTSLNRENAIYLNDGTGTFHRQENSGLGPSRGGMTMALADINGNGHLDLYVVNYKEKSARDLFPFTELAAENIVLGDTLAPPYDEHFTLIGSGDLPPEPREVGEKDELYFNNGDGTFTKATDLEHYFRNADGLPEGLHPDWGLAARFQDLNDDGLPDLYVANDFWTPDRVWLNQGGGTFRALDSLAIRNSSFSSMAVDFSDVNRNGSTDIFVVEMLSTRHQMRLVQMDPVYPYPLRRGEYRNRPQYNRNSLFVNRGDNTYAETSYFSGLHASEWSWATRFMDVTLDGYEDVLVNTGFKLDLQHLDAQMSYVRQAISGSNSEAPSLTIYPELKQQNRAFQNHGDLTFTDVSTEWGFDEEDISLGLAVADLNNDGYLDLAVSRMDDEGVLYRNTSSDPRIAVRLKGSSPNTQAIGAKIELRGGPVERQTKQIFAGGDYLSGSDPLVVFAADPDHQAHELVVRWPDQSVSKLDSLAPNRIYEIDQSTIELLHPENGVLARPTDDGSSTDEKPKGPVFTDVTDRLHYVHHEDPYNDFNVQPLLPWKLSQLGPGVAWFDLTGDGKDELLTGSGRGRPAGVFRADEDLGFTSLDFSLLSERARGDQTGIVGWQANGRTHLVVGMANYEQGSARVPSAIHYQIENGHIIDVDPLPGVLSTTGPLAAADYSGNGQVDLFVGGRFLPGQYPRDATSRLFRNEDGRLVPDRTNASLFEDIGLVTGALFVDLNGNSEQDLVVTTEWGPVRIFENNDGTFTERTAEWGLGRFNGLWQGVASGDFTGNGYPDLVVSNWGENSPYQVDNPSRPLKVFFDDFNQNQQLDILESYYDEKAGGYVPRRKYLQLAPLHESTLLHVGSHREFSELTISDLIQRDPENIPYKTVNTLQHKVLLNNEGKGFTVLPLPAEAQLAPAFYVGAADMDNNGTEDVFMSQNFFAAADPQSNPRMDGGRGLWLKGDGEGNFEVVPGHVSGVKVYGEQRGAALGDFDRNGRVDLAVAQNAAELRLFRNDTEKRGARITLSGPTGNASGIGSTVRLVYAEGRKGPARSIQAGSGYWSQNSLTQILGTDGTPVAIEVRWFDGTQQRVPFEGAEKDYIIRYPD